MTGSREVLHEVPSYFFIFYFFWLVQVSNDKVKRVTGH